MQDHRDCSDLARRYLDLWQDQITALYCDPELASALADLARRNVSGAAGTADLPPASGAAAVWSQVLPALMQAASPSIARAAEAEAEAASNEADSRRSADPHAGETQGSETGERTAAARTAADAAASDDGGHDLDGIARRLAVLEERLAELESRSSRERGGVDDATGGDPA